ncbi:MAG: hypothetical protein WA441_07320 [Methyloceanibacter sp.]
MPLLKVLILGFIVGFIATLIFHQGLWYLLNQVNLIPPERPAWPLDPIPPVRCAVGDLQGVLGAAFGARRLRRLWGARGARATGRAGPLVGAVALTLVAFFVVPPLKGEAIPALWPRFVAALLVNGAWGAEGH